MAATPSTMLALGTSAPNFALPNHGLADGEPARGATVTLTDIAGPKGTVVMFICNHCPFVLHIAHELANIADHYTPKGFGFVAINANNIDTHPDDAPDKMTDFARSKRYTFPYLFDDTQDVAKAFRAACTPDFFVFDADLRLAYRGQLDDARPNSPAPVNGRDLRAALDALDRGDHPDEQQTPSIGCNIKWKPGNAPEYFPS